MRKLFGTDGIRGIAGEYPLDKKTVFAVGQALGAHLPSRPQCVLIGQDTRESSAWIAETLASGLAEAGVSVENAGVITTPGIAHLTHSRSFSAGVVISASHNPWRDNGIKVFGRDGYKLPDEVELEIEQDIFIALDAPDLAKPPAVAPSLPGEKNLRHDYMEWLARSLPSLAGASSLRLVVDCANGAASAIAPEVFRRCGVGANFIHHTPNGRNINEGCGALHPEVVARDVVARGFDMGICLDGDADRALFADAAGNVVNGDAVMLLLARELKRQGRLASDTVVATTMSNMGLEIALRDLGVKMLRAPVGDKYVLEEMKKCGAVLGGEQSGHIILAQAATTGDGLLTALMVLAVVARSGQPLAALISELKVFPQVIRNVQVREKHPLGEIPAVQSQIERAERELNGTGRVVVRYSGTEFLARVMIEAESREKMEYHAAAIAEAIREALGVSGQLVR